MNIKQALDKLFALHQFGIKLGLEQIKNLLEHIGNPQDGLKTIHVAGSNGKGSTSSFIASILQEAGYKVGLYTSPHFVRFNERVRINGIEIPDEYIVNFMNNNEHYIDKNEPTFFELTTAIAFKYFYESQVDYAIIETGLGGRLDATNTITPLASVITTIGLEHTNILGSTIEQIAYEKACIIKKNRPVFVGYVDKSAEEVIKSKADEYESKIFMLKNFGIMFDNEIRIQFENFNYSIYSTPLKGNYQIINAALAVSVVSKLFTIDKKVFQKGIRHVLKNSGIQGRYEIYNESPRIIFDGAHNLDGLKVFLTEFNKESLDYKKRIALFGCMRDKNKSKMLAELSKHFDEVYVTTLEYERAAKIDELIEDASNIGIKVMPVENPVEFIQKFVRDEKCSCLVVLGSIYLVGNIKEKMTAAKRS